QGAQADSAKPKKGKNFHKLRIQKIGNTLIPPGVLESMKEDGYFVGDDDPVVVVRGQRFSFCHNGILKASDELTELPIEGKSDEVVLIPLYIPILHQVESKPYLILATRYPKVGIATDVSNLHDHPRGNVAASEGRIRISREPLKGGSIPDFVNTVPANGLEGSEASAVLTSQDHVLEMSLGHLRYADNEAPAKYLHVRDKYLIEMLPAMLAHPENHVYHEQILKNYREWMRHNIPTHETDLQDGARVGELVLNLIKDAFLHGYRADSNFLEITQKEAIEKWNGLKDERDFAAAEAAEQIIKSSGRR
ncbi:MAG: hypothetical protein IT434_18145, partial [Phycisphaerales bacterium]|nr:hypothetical protein [Phycisphaerales bacterium]